MLAAVSRATMAEVDRIAIDDYGIALAMMMEHAGRAVAAAARRMLGPLTGRRTVVLCGPGNNGGGGLCGARHLAVAGAAVTVALTLVGVLLAWLPARLQVATVHDRITDAVPAADGTATDDRVLDVDDDSRLCRLRCLKLGDSKAIRGR